MNAHIQESELKAPEKGKKGERKKDKNEKKKGGDMMDVKKDEKKTKFDWKLLILTLLMLFSSGTIAFSLTSYIRQIWFDWINIGIGLISGVLASVVVLLIATKRYGTTIPIAFDIKDVNPDEAYGKCISLRKQKRINPETKQKETYFIPTYEVCSGNKRMKVLGKATQAPPKIGETCIIKMS